MAAALTRLKGRLEGFVDAFLVSVDGQRNLGDGELDDLFKSADNLCLTLSQRDALHRDGILGKKRSNETMAASMNLHTSSNNGKGCERHAYKIKKVMGTGHFKTRKAEPLARWARASPLGPDRSSNRNSKTFLLVWSG